jgi:hypothetical protein
VDELRQPESARAALKELLLLRGVSERVVAELLAEAIDPTSRVDELLLARVEGVASATDFDPYLGHGPSGREGVSTTASDLALHVIGMDFGFHGSVSIALKGGWRWSVSAGFVDSQ